MFDYQFGFRKTWNISLAILDFVDRFTDFIDGGDTSIGGNLPRSIKSIWNCKSRHILGPTFLLWHQWNKEIVQCCVEGVNSNILPLRYGVPQGSDLGPTLFLININIWTDITRMLLKKIAKQLLFISRMPKLCAILELVSAPLNPVPTEEQLRWSHPLSEHSNWSTLVK